MIFYEYRFFFQILYIWVYDNLYFALQKTSMLKKIVIFMTISALIISCQQQEIKKAGYEGVDISSKAIILRDKQTKKASLDIQLDEAWVLYAGNSVETINFKTPLLSGEGKGVFPLDISDSVRTYFQLVTKESKAILADKHLPMTGGYNFRDLGGLKTRDGRYVKWGKVFRSDDLSKLTDADLYYLSSIPIASIVDFRTKNEISSAPDKTPPTMKGYYELNISPGNLNLKSMEDVQRTIATLGVDGVMKSMNEQLSTDSVCSNQYREYFKLLQSEADTPLMFHCSAGKDRTGMGAALFLLALGVDEATIMDDYLLSNTYLADKYARVIEQNPRLKSMFTVKSEYLQAGIDQIKKDHGSVENFLVNILNVDINKMKEMYLY